MLESMAFDRIGKRENRGHYQGPKRRRTRDGELRSDRGACSLKQDAVSRPGKTRRAGGPIRSRKEKVRRERLRRMPEETKPEDLTWIASGLSSNGESVQIALNLGVLFGPAKIELARNASRGMGIPELPQMIRLSRCELMS